MSTAVRGRPRDPRVDAAVTEELVALLAERGPDGFSIDELAARSGVGKATIYRRFRSRDELIAAGLASINADMPQVDHLPLREALITLLEWSAGTHAAGMTPTWLVSMQQIPQLRELYAQRVIEPRRAALRAVLERARAQGLLGEVDIEVALTALSAPAVMIGMHRARGYNAIEVADVVDLLLNGLLSPAARANGS